MFFHLELANGIAVYEQIVRQVKFAVAEGTLREGELVPSVRELARDLAVNPNTVARAYRQLQNDGILDAVRGTGLAVATEAKRLCRDSRRELLGTRMSQVIDEALRSGLSDSEVERLFQQQLRRVKNSLEKST